MIDYGAYYVGCPVKFSPPKQVDYFGGIHHKTGKPIAEGLLGHVIGYDLTEFAEGHQTTIKVQWADGRVFSTHPNNIERL